eukprot:11151808-Alexandrium_andersonii.AAC.1
MVSLHVGPARVEQRVAVVAGEQPLAPVHPLHRVHWRVRDARHPQRRRGQVNLTLQDPVGGKAVASR